jgi:hypothetical protein
MSEQNHLDHAARILATNVPRREAIRLILAGAAGAALAAVGLPRAWGDASHPNQELCGPAGWVARGTCCNKKTGAVCPKSRCYDPPGHGSSDKICCPSGRVVCGGRRCCNPGEVCAGSRCCAPDKVCKNRCCAPDEECVKSRCRKIVSHV